jgi:hypothetical protein
MAANRCHGRDKKVRYPRERSAKMALVSAIIAGRPERRAYHCPICKGWHLTSQPKTPRIPPGRQQHTQPKERTP